MPKPKAPHGGLTTISTRLFDDDIAELKRRANAEGIRWQIKLRLLVHEALKHTARLA